MTAYRSDRRRPAATRRGDRGSVLMLMPAAVLIVLLLGAIAVDSAVVYLAQRQAYNVAFDAANDAAGAGFDRETARRSGEIRYEPERVHALAAETVAVAGLDDVTLVDVAIEPDGSVAVTVEVVVEHVFAAAFGRRTGPLRLTARAQGVVISP